MKEARSMKRAVAVICVALGGCHASVGYQWGMPSGSHTQTSVVDLRVGGEVNSTLGAILIGILVADGVRYYWRLPDGSRRPYYGTPEADLARSVNVQDCTRPVNPAAGNLMCQ